MPEQWFAGARSGVGLLNIAALQTATWPGGRPALVQLISNVQLGDNGSLWRWDGTSTATANGHSIVKEDATTTGRWLKQYNADFLASDFGLVPGEADSTADLQAAIDAAATFAGITGGSALVRLPQGVINTNQITLKTGVYLQGAGMQATILRLRNGRNETVIKSQGADALWSGLNAGGIDRWGITGLTIDGNEANNTSGHGLQVYGRAGEVHQLMIQNVAEVGWWNRHGVVGLTETPRAIEAIVSHVYTYNTGKEGIIWGGPNDSHLTDVFVVNASQLGDGLHDGVYIEDRPANGRWTRLHVWRWDPASFGAKVHRWSFNTDCAGVTLVASHLEGGWLGNTRLNGQLCEIVGCVIYATSRPSGGATPVNLLIERSYCEVSGMLFGPAPGTIPSIGIQLGTGSNFPAMCKIDMVSVEQMAGVVDFTNSGIGNAIHIRGVNSLSGTFVVGSPPVDCDVDIYVSGPAGGRLKQRSGPDVQRSGIDRKPTNTGIAAAGTDQATATLLSDGVVYHLVTSGTGGVRLPPIGVGGQLQVMNVSGGAINVYPPVGSEFQVGGVNTPYSLPNNAIGTNTQLTSTYWTYGV